MKQVKEILILSGAVFIISAAVFFFLVPSHCSVSSISGLAILLTNVLPFSVAQLTMALNVALLLVGFLTCGREFGAKTVYTSILLPLFIGLFEKLLPDYTSLTGDMTLDVICYIFTVSVGLAILFNRNASSGGLDIVAKVMNKYLHIELGKAMSAAGMCIALSSAFFYDSKTVVLSVLGTYLNGIVLDHFIFDQSVKRRVCIVSEKSDEIRNFILKELHSGASVYRCIGALRMNEQEEIITIVSKSEYQQLMNYLQKTDPTAFVTVYKVNDMRYIPKSPDYGNDA
ncbi:MAG: YitT family protein [Clostridium sp.]|nr:YitT family protein [Clostridium sp.]MBP3216346.1 YitT family protein [Clostridium sp.]MBQ4148544.1 YitT family protein [Clostridium sp.]MBQ5421204.1 YitT family protein [Clostridium sp.]